VSKYNIYTGKFKCQQCGVEVSSIRSYPETKDLTWMCPDKHLSRVSLNVKKTKKDYEREERE
jgi:hypothetical protein